MISVKSSISFAQWSYIRLFQKMLSSSGSSLQPCIHLQDVEDTIAAFDAVREKLKAGEYMLEKLETNSRKFLKK
jgi:hypothetical protein